MIHPHSSSANFHSFNTELIKCIFSLAMSVQSDPDLLCPHKQLMSSTVNPFHLLLLVSFLTNFIIILWNYKYFCTFMANLLPDRFKIMQITAGRKSMGECNTIHYIGTFNSIALTNRNAFRLLAA